MKSRFRPLAIALIAGAIVAPAVRAAKPASDIVTTEQRRTVLQKAERLAHPPAAAALPAELVSPFNPPAFEQPDSSEAAARNEAHASETKAAAGAAATDRDVLAAVAAKIPTTGTIIVGGKPLLISGTNRIEAGSRFTVVYNGQEYELELVAIDRTTFTVRYKGEEFTRPIKLGKTP